MALCAVRASKATSDVPETFVRGVTFAVLLLLLKLFILAFAVLFAPLPDVSWITSPSLNPASTKSVDAVVTEVPVVVMLSVKDVLRAAAETVRVILEARASVVSDVDPTLRT